MLTWIFSLLGGQWGLLGRSFRRHQLVRHSRQACNNYAKGHPARPTNPRRTRLRLLFNLLQIFPLHIKQEQATTINHYLQMHRRFTLYSTQYVRVCLSKIWIILIFPPHSSHHLKNPLQKKICAKCNTFISISVSAKKRDKESCFSLSCSEIVVVWVYLHFFFPV